MNHNAGNRHALQCSERTGLSRSLKKLGLVAVLTFLSLTCQGGDGGTTGIPPITVAFYQIDTDAAWSPDGKSILFVKGDWPDSAWRGGIYLHDLATGRDSLISGNYLASSLTWSPDQEWIAYSQGAQIYVMKINGDSITQITSAGRNFRCRWSPTANRIAYDESSIGLWLSDKDGEDKRPVYVHAGHTDWFADGVRLAGLGLGGDVYILDTMGQRYDRITSTGLPKSNNVAVSPDGTAVVFVQLWQLWIVNVDGSNLTQLTLNGGNWPDWSPDGKWIVYTNGGDKNGHLWLMKPDGREKHQITF